MAEEKVDHVMRELRRIAGDVERAQKVANEAMAEIGTHERECALRYEGIMHGLKPIPSLFELIAKTNRVVYIGVGVMITVPVLFGLILTLKELVAK